MYSKRQTNRARAAAQAEAWAAELLAQQLPFTETIYRLSYK